MVRNLIVGARWPAIAPTTSDPARADPRHDEDRWPCGLTQHRRTAAWLIAIAAIALVAVGGVGGWLLGGQDEQPFTEERQAITLTADQQEAITTVAAHRDAQNTGDRDAMLATLATNAVWSSVADGRTGDPMSAEDYVQVAIGYGPELWTWTGDPSVVGTLPNPSGNLQVAVPTRRGISGGPDADGTMVFTLHDVDGQLKITEIYWMQLDR